MGDIVDCAANPINCAKDVASSEIGDAVTGPIQDLIESIFARVIDTLVYFMTFWLRTPSASLDSDDPVGGAIVQVQNYTTTITAFFAVLGILIVAARMAWMVRIEPVKDVGLMFLRVMFVQAIAMTATQILIQAGDEFSPWLVETALGETMNNSIATLMPFLAGSGGEYVLAGTFIATQGFGAMLIIGIILLIVTALQVLFLLLRDVLLAIILAFLPTLAAASLFKSGDEGFQKALGWIVGLTLYKPVAAVIYVLGTLLVKGVAGDQGTPGQEWMAMLLGTMTLILAVVALPALMKFVAPAAGRGVSSAFSGGAALGAAAGVAATGAAVVAIVGTGGAAAPAAAPAAAGASGAGAGAAGAGAAGAGGAGAGAAAGGGATAGAGGGAAAGGAGGASGGASTGGGGGTSGASGSQGAASDSGSGGTSGTSEGASSHGTESEGTSSPGAGSAGGEASGGGASGAPVQGASGSGSDSGSRAQAVQSIASEVGDSGEKNGAAVEDMTK